MKKVLEMVLNDRKLKIRGIAVELKISKGSENLSMRTHCAKWMPRIIADQKIKHIVDFRVTEDETWIPYYTSEFKEALAEWKAVGESRRSI